MKYRLTKQTANDPQVFKEWIKPRGHFLWGDLLEANNLHVDYTSDWQAKDTPETDAYVEDFVREAIAAGWIK